ncbi:bola-like protein [Athelia psychrophila]|uniref:Bola-like protein n=1 Tax=Athelia psychrophila TaxID=1759441 RepID=A0A166BXJ2_9AGAM|nr:bola-like protein [Fibularhizoctonia sp. CBS 109695]
MLSLARRIRLPAARQARFRGYTTGPPPPSTSPRNLSEGEQVIHGKLSDRFAPSELLVQDVSGGCGSFYSITIASQAFKGLPVVKQHKLVTQVLKEEIEGIHGLQIKTIPV